MYWHASSDSPSVLVITGIAISVLSDAISAAALTGNMLVLLEIQPAWVDRQRKLAFVPDSPEPNILLDKAVESSEPMFTDRCGFSVDLNC